MQTSVKNQAADAAPIHYGWIVVAMGTLVVFGALGLARFGYAAVLPAMQTALNMDNTQAGVLATANLAGYVLFSAAGGALASRFGPRAVIAFGLCAAGIGMLFTGLSQNFAQAAAWRAVTGMGSGASNVPAMGLLSAWATSRRRGTVAGIAVTGSSLALIVVGPVAPRLLAAFEPDGWRACWFAYAAVTLLLAAAAALVLRNRPSDVGLAALGARAGDPPAASTAGRLDWRRIYRAPAVWHLGLVYVAFGFSYIIYMTFFIKRLIAGGGYSAPQAGRLFMLMGLFSLFCGVIWGFVSDRIGRKRALAIVYLIHAAAFSLFACRASPLAFTASAVLFGLSAWSIPAIMAATCGDILGPTLAPAALGFVTLFFGIGQAIGPSVAGAVADAARAFEPVFLLAAGVALLGALGVASLRAASTTRATEN